MYPNRDRGVPKTEHMINRMDWNAVQTFLVVARRKSFRAAAAELGVSVNKVRREIERLEDQLGFRFYIRGVTGLTFTQEGQALVRSASRVENAVFDLFRSAASASQETPAPIKLAVTEGIGTFWLIPRIVEHIENSSEGGGIDLRCAMHSADVLRLEADISIQLTRPTAPDLIARRIGYLHMVPFASPAYVAEHGAPRTVNEAIHHRIVEQATEQLGGYGLDRIFSPEIERRIVKLRTNFSSAHYWAIAKGAGIGLLPTYAMAIGADVVPIDIPMDYRVEIWLSVHPDLMRSVRHRVFVDWLVSSFDAQRYPWFSEKYIPAAEIARLYPQNDLRQLFAGFLARAA